MGQNLSADEFDERALAELRSSLDDSFVGFVEQFIATARAVLDDIDELLRQADSHEMMARVQAQAHSLRGTAGYLGAIGMTSALEALEQATRAGGDRDEVRHHAATARDAFLKVQGRLLTNS